MQLSFSKYFFSLSVARHSVSADRLTVESKKKTLKILSVSDRYNSLAPTIDYLYSICFYLSLSLTLSLVIKEWYIVGL